MSQQTGNNKLFALISALESGKNFDHPVEHFEIVETHISFVLLTGPFAYKFKKPVDLGFLDFSTLEKRKHYCEEELRLNSRHAPEIYVDVITITGTEQSPVINGDGPVLEYGVRMVQFDRDRELDKLISTGGVTPALIDKLAQVIVAFHAAADVAPADSPYGSLENVRKPLLENFSRIKSGLQTDKDTMEQLDALERWSDSEYEKLIPVFEMRKTGGFIRECHGDLHLGNIVLFKDQPVLFDCIEFSKTLHWIDIMNDIAFLVMDLDEHRCHALSHRLLNACLESGGDYAGLAVLRYYLVYRALVRAKVACIRLEQDTHDKQARSNYRRYVDLATDYTKPARPILYLTCGVSATGKTTVSQALLEKTGAIRIRSDVERKRLHGLAADVRSGSAIDAGLYSKEITGKTYTRLQQLAGEILEAGYSVIADATFLQAPYRQDFFRLAERCHITPVILHCVADKAILEDRLRQRNLEAVDASEADIRVLLHQLETLDPLDDTEKKYTVEIDTGQQLDFESIQSAVDNLRLE